MLFYQEDEEVAEGRQSIIDVESDVARALADLELVAAAYPDEVELPPELKNAESEDGANERAIIFPIQFELRFNPASIVKLEMPAGYPTRGPGLRVVSYRSNSAECKPRLELAVSAIRKASLKCFEDGIEAALACCAAGLESWREWSDLPLSKHPTVDRADSEASTSAIALDGNSLVVDHIDNSALPFGSSELPEAVEWVSGNPIVEKKSVFQAHVCRIACEAQVRAALHRLIDGNSKLQRATHNMVRSILSYEKRVMPTFVSSSHRQIPIFLITRRATHFPSLLPLVGVPGARAREEAFHRRRVDRFEVRQ
jgi:hypothetical protein